MIFSLFFHFSFAESNPEMEATVVNISNNNNSINTNTLANTMADATNSYTMFFQV